MNNTMKLMRGYQLSYDNQEPDIEPDTEYFCEHCGEDCYCPVDHVPSDN